jgi:hypothetical protein
MTVQTVKLGRERFVLLREKDYRELKPKANRAGPYAKIADSLPRIEATSPRRSAA